MNDTALNHYLEPLNKFLEDSNISEISINEPGMVYIERLGFMQKNHVPELTYYWLQGLANLVARFSNQILSERNPLLSAALPHGHRIQIVMPPASEANKLIFSIRKQVISDLSLDQYEAMRFFKEVKPHTIKTHRSHLNLSEEEISLAKLFSEKNYLQFLKNAILLKKNILISGGTSTGKTSFLNACLKEIPHHERIITLEDVREINIPHENKVNLLASKGEQGIAKVTMVELIEASLRLRPDRIIMGELRGREAADFINATATGHEGSLATIHASNPSIALMRLVHMVKLNPSMTLSREDILADLHHLIDIIVQLKRVHRNGTQIRYVSEIYSAFNS